MNLRTKIVLIGMVQLVAVAGLMFALYYHDAKKKVQQQYVAKARSVVLTAEAMREEMANKWHQGIFNAEQLRTWADAGEVDKILAAVPVVTAWKAAMARAEEGGYQFKVPKFRPRNPKNKPDELEARVLKMFEQNNLSEYYVIDEKTNAIRYFRPIRLTEECMLCHGDPAKSAQYWGNDEGLDPTGAQMEGWKVGDVHGAFEVVQSLDEANAAIAASMRRGAMLVGIVIVVGGVLFFFFVRRGIEGLYRPIRRIAGSLAEGAIQVNSAASQVASTAQQLAEGSSEQAASLQETSSALEELAAQTRSNAENARKANELGQQAREAARNGDHTTSQLGDAMAAINEASAQIGKIIKVIEEIAFQTNLLALNAAVEAARAGEHGKGFAVVADEVRSLAQRTAEASREITSLIENSVNKAKEGTMVADEVGKALGAIVQNVTEVTGLINNIATASEEQAQGVEQINSAVSQMDKVTQQNAAGAEEGASAAEELNAQAAMVKNMVDELMSLVGGAEAGSPPPAKRPAGQSARPAAKAAAGQGAKVRPATSVGGASSEAGAGATGDADGFLNLEDGQDLAEF